MGQAEEIPREESQDGQGCPGVRAAIYVRVSTADQDCALQLRELRTYIKARGWDLAGEYVDTGWSGAKASRPELDRLMQAARKREVDCILVWKLDRWGRSVANLVASLQELHSLGVRWIATTQGLDTDESSPVGRLLIHMLSAVAEFERALAQERIRAGLLAARARGVHCGRPRKIVDRVRVADMRDGGMSYRAIGRKLGISLAMVQRTLQRGVSEPRRSPRRRAVSEGHPPKGPNPKV